MSSQKQCHRTREALKWVDDVIAENTYLRSRCEWFSRRPPWWKFWAIKRWKGEEPR